MRVVRWGRSAYETDEDLSIEREGCEAAGCSWSLHVGEPPDDLGDVLVVPSHSKARAPVVERFSGSLIQTTTSGYDHVALDVARAKGIRVARLPEARRDAVVEQALGMLVHLMRQVPALATSAGKNRWARGDLPALAGRGLRGSTIAVVGCGVIGSRMVELLDVIGATVLGVDPRGVPAPALDSTLHEALAECDAVTIHSSLTDSSRGLFDADVIGLLQPHAVLVNTARGPIVDVPAAVEALEAGRIRGLGLDVFPTEPWSDLRDQPGVIMLPHAAGFTHDLGERVAEGVVDAVSRHVDGLPPRHPVG